MQEQSLIQALRDLSGGGAVTVDELELRFFAQDVYGEGAPPLAVVRPATVESLAAMVAAATAAGVAVIPRGGGMSYSAAFLGDRGDFILLDLTALDRIVEINDEDMFVTLECGATWKTLDDALAERGLRTPYWGPLSGLRATVGGALSQGSMFLGSGRYGVAADSLLGLDVVLADGSLAGVGSHANAHGEPFLRHYGPDLCGIFTGDCGAFGIKARATLKLILRPGATRHASFVFEDQRALFAAMSAVARQDLASESFAFDPRLQAVRLKRASLLEDAKSLKEVVRAAGGIVGGLKEGAKLIAAGRSFLKAADFSLHLSFDGRDAQDAEARLARARQVIGNLGREVQNSIPTVMRSRPFGEVTSMLGPGGERWVPVHGTVPFSQIGAMYDACEKLFADARGRMEALQVEHGYLISAVSTCGILLEPVLYWPDARQLFHERSLPAGYLAKLPVFAENRPARELVASIRTELARLFMERGAVSFQLGRFYFYQEGLAPASAALLAQVKALLDPQSLMNPGSIGLGTRTVAVPVVPVPEAAASVAGG